MAPDERFRTVHHMNIDVNSKRNFMKNVARTAPKVMVGLLLAASPMALATTTPASAAAKPGCSDIPSIQEFSKALATLNPMGDPKAQSVSLKKSADRLKSLTKTAPKDLKADYEFMGQLMADLSTGFAKVDPTKPQTIAKALDPLTKGQTKLALIGPHLAAYATKNCK